MHINSRLFLVKCFIVCILFIYSRKGMKISLLQWLLYVLSALYCSPFELRSTFNILRRRYFFLAAQKATMCISDIGMKLSTLLKSHSIRELMGLDVASRCLKISTIKCFKVFPTQTLNAPKPKCVLKFSQHKL